MTQFDFIKDIARFGLENDQEKLLFALNELIEFSRKSKKINFALQLQSILKEGLKSSELKGLSVVGSQKYLLKEEDLSISELIIEKITSDYTFDNLVCSENVKEELEYFVKEHKAVQFLKNYDLPISNKVLFYGPSGCGKTLASYVLAGELEKMMYVINLGAIVSSKLGETSKNLAKIFKKVASENCIIFLDEFDSLGKVRDYNQDHGEMKRVVNTILQLFDYLPQESIVIAATNQQQMIDDALLRRFDIKVKLDIPNRNQIRNLINIVIKNTPFKFSDKKELARIIQLTQGLSYYVIQKTLITAIKRTLFKYIDNPQSELLIETNIWEQLIFQEKK